MFTQLLPDVALLMAHAETGTFVVTTVAQFVAVQLEDVAGAEVHLSIPVGPVVFVTQVVVVNRLPALGAVGVHADTGDGPTTLGVQVVAVYALPELADAGLHVRTGVGPVATGLQLVAV